MLFVHIVPRELLYEECVWMGNVNMWFDFGVLFVHIVPREFLYKELDYPSGHITSMGLCGRKRS